MACFHLIDAWQLTDGSIVFKEAGDIRRPLRLPCGNCVGCRMERSRMWAIRAMHEASLHEKSCFLTLTYNDENLPPDKSLRYRDFQDFMKRWRKRRERSAKRGCAPGAGPGEEGTREMLASEERAKGEQSETHEETDEEKSAGAGLRFYMSGEYGEKYGRPHYHALVFGGKFEDMRLYKTMESGAKLYTSEELSELWGLGFASVGEVTFESAAYVARYVMKKIGGDAAAEHYKRLDLETGEWYWLTPEFSRMSLKPGIGAKWFEKWRADVYPHDYTVVNGMKMKPPKYYDQLLRKIDGFMADEVAFEREKRAEVFQTEMTDERLRVREQVAHARLRYKPRNLG